MIPVSILGTGTFLPSRRVTTGELVAEILPGADTLELERRIGIQQRFWLGPGETAALMGARALQAALDRAGLEASALRRIIFVTSTGGDQMIPATANGIALEMGLQHVFDAFDLNNSCIGFLSGFDVAARSVATGISPVGVVAVETFSRHISPAGRRAYLVLGDAAAAAILGKGTDGEGVVCSVLRNSNMLRGQMIMHYPSNTQGRGYHEFDTPNEDIVNAAVTLTRQAVQEALAASELELSDIRWVLPHQPNGQIFDLLVEHLGVRRDQLVPIFPEIGSVGSASVPSSLDRLLRERSVDPGSHILLTGVGSGTAYGAIVYRFAG